MNLRVFASALIAAIALQSVPLAGIASPPALGLHVRPCTEGRAKVSANCGTFGVYENRDAHNGRVIQLRLVVLKAKHPAHRAIALIAGGPGQSAADFAEPVADGAVENALATLRDSYDILLVDERGMGGSNSFGCNFTPISDPASYFRSLWPSNLVSACWHQSLATHNPSMYNTNNSVDDLDDIRAALGYPKLVLSGGSYGTFTSLIYLRRHEAHVESLVLDSVMAPHFKELPGDPGAAQTALSDLEQKCRVDALCEKNFPKFTNEFDAVLHRFDRGPIAMKLKNAKTKQIQNVALSKEVFVDRLRQILYQPESAAAVPFVIHRAYGGDYSPLAQIIDETSQLFSQILDNGANLGYSCAEWIPFISEDVVKAAAAHSFAGDLRVRAQQKACTLWPVPPMPPSFNDPVRSNVPILVISGSDDPATPPKYATEALADLPNAAHAVVKGAGHSTENACTDDLVVTFVRHDSAKGLDVSRCSESLSLPKFVTSAADIP